jgi:pyrimidine deaminase RibD-like protein
VRDGRVIGEGATLQVGGDHAEIRLSRTVWRVAIARVVPRPMSHWSLAVIMAAPRLVPSG